MALERAEALAARAKVSTQTFRTHELDLRRPGSLEEVEALNGGPFWLAHGARFLERRVLARLRDGAIMPGTAIRLMT